MKLSTERRQAVFDAIHEPVMKERVTIQGRRRRTTDVEQIRQLDQIDSELFYFDVDIFKRVLAALNVKES